MRAPVRQPKTGKVSWSGQQKRRPPSFRFTLMLSSAENVFSSRKLVTLHRYCVLLPSSCHLSWLQFLSTWLGRLVFRHVRDWQMLSQYQKGLLPRMLMITGLSLLRVCVWRYLKRSWLGRWIIFWRETVCFLLLSFLSMSLSKATCRLSDN